MEKEGIQSRIYDYPDLIKIDMAPNENIIFHLYKDGALTSQKGSWAYGSRSEFTILPSIRPHPDFVFPAKGYVRLPEQEGTCLRKDIEHYTLEDFYITKK